MTRVYGYVYELSNIGVSHFTLGGKAECPMFQLSVNGSRFCIISLRTMPDYDIIYAEKFESFYLSFLRIVRGNLNE
ncbi:hypothetical protein PEX1_037660 [Penicillium expansum]|uniref:Uncharacterized protein n=1 Tax=Penicillium expansum TaxID=27334 RepID=A0A0A2J818_PENEN|nr:hypothetical protein PEX2_095730 [Penicillium expansum]KGO36418.1 hypothetical protein PEXP_102630 [Penicillium expansum]KGO50916.1 hypothetical protein PEX2_095730 [Penicillium expansum]KGO63789.1 hypothetical protein PEX1_037660 [Penicillium expansum]